MSDQTLATLSPEELLEQINSISDPVVSKGFPPTETKKIETDCSLVVPIVQLNKDSSPALSSIDFDGFDIKDPVELLLLLDENILNGTIKLHPWQAQFMIDFANSRWTKADPFKAVVRACNGSGKDKYIIAACAVWLCMRYMDTYCPITSSSGNQLDSQTCFHITRLCNKANALFGPIWNTKYRHYELDHKDERQQSHSSVIKCFATDEPGKAEGFHPVDAGKKMAIFTSETKSIPQDITTALARCIGFTHRVDASSPGPNQGYLYDTCNSSIYRGELLEVESWPKGEYVQYFVQDVDCPHITPEEIDFLRKTMPGGELGVAFQSSMKAQFGTTEEMVVIPYSFVKRATLPDSGIIWISEEYNTAGLDLSDGGAETVLLIRNGNKHIKTFPFRFDDTQDTIAFLEQKFRENGLLNKKALIFTDVCGIGKPIADSLKAKKWSNIRYVDSRNSASDKKVYYNRGTELFFNVRKLLERKELIISPDDLLIKQLSGRKYKINTDNVHCLLTKLEQKAKGYLSPDRADAFNLAFWNYKSTRAESTDDAPFDEEQEDETKKQQELVGDFDQKSWAYGKDRHAYVAENHKYEFSEIQEELAEINKQIVLTR